MTAAEELLAARLSNQQLSAPGLGAPEQVVAHLGAVQSQDYPAAKWAIGLRLNNATDAQIEQAFAEGKILRTHVLRPTWHFVVPTDIRWMLTLTAPRIKAAMGSYMRTLGLDDAYFASTTRIVAQSLEGGKHLTRPELGAALRGAGFEMDASRLLHVTFRAELDGVAVSGAPRGKQHTYALLEERVAPAPPLTRDEALAELTWRYFNSHGPALLTDCSWWSGLTLADVKRGVAQNAHRLQSNTVDGRTYWSGPSACSGLETTVHLLPNYDEYTVAYRSRDLYFDPNLNPTGNPREDVPFRGVIVACGKVVGRWTRGSKQTSWWIAPSPRMQKELERTTSRYDAFLGGGGATRSSSS